MSKGYIYNRLGFPIVITGVKPKKTPYGVATGIDHEVLIKKVFKIPAEKPYRFIGAEIKFIRHEMELTEEVFGNLIFYERNSVAKWEKKDLKPTGMSETTEVLLKIEMSKQLKKMDINKIYEKAWKSVRTGEQEMLRYTA